MISDIPVVGWVLAIASALILGLAKSGLKGMGVIIVMLLALAFESKASTGILMPLLIIGDIFAVIYYHRHAQWSHLWRLLPWMLAGVLIGVWFGKDLDEEQFKHWMAVLILSATVLMIWGEIRKRLTVPKHGIFGATMGLLAGISTMIGNLAGPFADLYFLAMRLPKQNFIGTAAWLFFIVNIFKLPFHIFVWRTITTKTLLIDLWLLPAVVGGLITGVWLVSRIHDLRYRKIVIVLTAIGAILILTG
ncbi:MAG TPA: sulfite exporter TauE/SafE family protein [Saprospiraceae bacterium]|nr:sulfite exporter TauE/SafE family protein [Saprospiraceae bacterium]